MQTAPAPARPTARHALARGDFRRLLATRLLSQAGDGVFQAAVAGTVLFNPQRAADPIDVAAGFAVLLLPYSLVGPFAGVWLDRWSRRQVLLLANLLRAVLVLLVGGLVVAGVAGLPFYGAGLAVFSVNRFVLSALSAALPHTIDEPALVSANALSTTSGAMATVTGGGLALGLLQVIGSGDGGYALLAAASALPYVAASAVVAGFGRPSLGPDCLARSVRPGARDVLAGLAAGARHVLGHVPAASALAVMAVHRVLYGLLTLLTLLLYRNSFRGAGGFFPGGLTGLGEVLAVGAAGTLLAAAVTPWAVRRIGKAWWMTAMLAAAGAGEVLLGGLFTPPATVAAGFVLGFVAQAVKICVDTTLQEAVDDDFRGRVFSVYDTVFNVSFVGALLAAASWLPASGRSLPALVVVGTGYLVAAAVFARWCLRRQRRISDVLHPAAPATAPARVPAPVRDRRVPPATGGGRSTS